MAGKLRLPPCIGNEIADGSQQKRLKCLIVARTPLEIHGAFDKMGHFLKSIAGNIP